MEGLVEMGYIGLNKNKRNGENNEFKDKITFEFALDTLPSNGTRTRALFSDSGTFELLGTVNIPSGQKLALGSPSRSVLALGCPVASNVTITGEGTISGEGTITGGGFG